MKFKRLSFCLFFFLLNVLSYAQDSLESISPDKFQNLVLRQKRLDEISKDSSVSKTQQDFAKAAALYYAGQFEEANKQYDALLNNENFAGNILLRQADIHFQLNQFSELRKTLQKASNFLTTSSWEKKALFLRTKASLVDSSLSDKDKVDSTALFLNKFPKSQEATEIRFQYAKYSESIGNTKQAKRAYLRVLAAGYNPKDSTFNAVRRLRTDSEEETVEEKWAYAQILCNNGSPQECLNLIDSVLALDSLKEREKNSILETPEDSLLFRLPPSHFDLDTRKKIWEKRAVALRGVGNFEESYKQFRFLIDSVEAKALWMQSSIKLLRKDTEKNAKAIAELDAMLEEANKYGSINANNLWLRGFEFEQKKKYDKAIACYKKLNHPKFGSNQKRQWALFRTGLIYLKQNKFEQAEKTFKEASKLPFTWSASGARMFLGDAYLAQKKDSLAKEAYLDCIKDFPLGYYAHRSRTKLLESKLLEADKIPLAKGIPLSEAETDKWIKKQQRKTGTYSKTTYALVKKLMSYGFVEDAFQIYQGEYSKHSKRLDFLYAYGNLFLEAGEVAIAYRLARMFQNRISRKVLAEAPVSVLRFLYPLPYKDRVFEKAGEAIDPYFVYSVMRQESIFDFQITSPVGARGLLQIMPATGKSLAELEAIQNFTPDMLYNPYLNIRLGIRYLIDLKQEYNNDYMYVLGNYNAGPKPAKRWQKTGEGLSWDIRAEDISYWETRDYVKRVMGNYWIYQEIWEGTL